MWCFSTPAFARSKQAVPRALSGYKDINLLGIRLTKPEGIVSPAPVHITFDGSVEGGWTGSAGRQAVSAVTGAAGRLPTIPSSQRCQKPVSQVFHYASPLTLLPNQKHATRKKKTAIPLNRRSA
jgi:hypothetical protein